MVRILNHGPDAAESTAPAETDGGAAPRDVPVEAGAPVAATGDAIDGEPSGTDTMRMDQMPVGGARTATAERPTTPSRPAGRRGWTRVGAGATLGLLIGITGLYATLTGLLVPVGITLGVIGLLVTSAGLAGARHDRVTGHSLALLGMVASAAAVVLGVMAVAGSLPWLHGHTDTVLEVRNWLDAQLPWLKGW